MSKKDEQLKEDLEGLHFSILQDWVDKGRKEKLPEEMAEYIEQLDMVRGFWYSCNTPNEIIKKLRLHYPDLNILTAKSRFEDAACYFFMDDKIKQYAWRNMIFEKQLQLVDAAILSAKSVDDYSKASQILERAYRAKMLHEKEEEVIPEGAFDKPIKVYTLKTKDVGLPEANRYKLADYIDSMNVVESEKVRFKQEAGMEPKTIFEYNGEED